MNDPSTEELRAKLERLRYRLRTTRLVCVECTKSLLETPRSGPEAYKGLRVNLIGAAEGGDAIGYVVFASEAEGVYRLRFRDINPAELIGEPVSLLVGDFYFSEVPESVWASASDAEAAVDDELAVLAYGHYGASAEPAEEARRGSVEWRTEGEKLLVEVQVEDPLDKELAVVEVDGEPRLLLLRRSGDRLHATIEGVDAGDANREVWLRSMTVRDVHLLEPTDVEEALELCDFVALHVEEGEAGWEVTVLESLIAGEHKHAAASGDASFVLRVSVEEPTKREGHRADW